MPESDVPASFDPAAYRWSALAVDLIRMGLEGGQPAVILSGNRARDPRAGPRAPVGGIVGIAETFGGVAGTDVVLARLPEAFTLRRLRDLHERILAAPSSKSAFRRHMRERGWIAPPGAREAGAGCRPADLTRFDRSRQSWKGSSWRQSATSA